MTGVFVKKEDRWQPILVPQVNVEGVWWACKNVFVRANDEWHQVWSLDVQYLTVPNFYKEIHDVRTCAA
jgi:hypothetical protein